MIEIFLIGVAVGAVLVIGVAVFLIKDLFRDLHS